MPATLAQLLLRQKIIIRPGLETLQPEAAAARYRADLETAGCALAGKRVLIFGYGGNFAVGCSFLQSGARQVVLCDRYAPPDDERNRALLPQYAGYLDQQGGQVRPKREALQLLEADIRQAVKAEQIEPVDVVVSTSVFEHLDDVEGIAGALAAITCPGGAAVHYIDLRDHFFRYPFAMLSYSTRAWRDWLNPGSNLNRYRLWQYRQAFEAVYAAVDLSILAQDRPAFERARGQIRPEYLSGNVDEDCATLIRVVARDPLTPVSGPG
jgi:hypothetical protein